MRRSTFPYPVKKFCLGLLMVMCITSIMVFPVSASAEAATVDLEMVNDEVFSAPFALSKTGLSYAVQERFSLAAFCLSFSSAAASI